MTDVCLTITGELEYILKNLIEKGFFKTENEAIRAGVLELGKEYALIGSSAYYREQLNKMTQKKKLTVDKVIAELENLEK